jgi:hypothetical protein
MDFSKSKSFSFLPKVIDLPVLYPIETLGKTLFAKEILIFGLDIATKISMKIPSNDSTVLLQMIV